MSNHAFGALLLFTLLSSCSTVDRISEKTGDLTGSDTWRKAGEEMTPRQEYFLGRSLTANALKESPLVDGPINAYLNRLGTYLTLFSPRPEHFKGYFFGVIQSETSSALSTPGGHILLTTALLKRIQSEDELAGVIAHELAHIALRHAAISIKSSYRNSAFTGTAVGIVGFLAGGNAPQGVAELFGGAVTAGLDVMKNGYNRDQEIEADAAALTLLEKANYNPRALLEAIRRNESKGGGHFSNHPADEVRIKAMEKILLGKKMADGTGKGVEARAQRFLSELKSLSPTQNSASR